MNYNMDGKVVIITGGSKGIGKGIVQEFLASNATVIFTARNESEGKAAEAEYNKIGKTEYVKSDCAKEADVITLMDYVAEKYGKIDCVVNNAAYVFARTQPLHEYSYENCMKMFEVNAGGVFLMMKYAIAKMLQQPEGGSIVNISSGCSKQNWANHAVYAASKYAVNKMTASAAKEYGNQNIRINVILPGTIETEAYAPTRISHPGFLEAQEVQIPLQHFGKPKDIGRAAAWLCSDEASHVTGTLVTVDGGLFL